MPGPHSGPRAPGAGRKPKPTALKLLLGNPGGRPLNDAEPQYPVKLPSCPAHLAALARTEWKRIGKMLLAQGVITEADRAALAGYCVAWGRHAEAEARIKRFGMLLNVRGALEPSPYLAISERWLVIADRFGAQLGLSPSSRTRIRAHAPRPQADDFADLFEGAT